MERFGAVTTVCVVALIGVVLAPNASADAWNRKSEKTFNEQVEIPANALLYAIGNFSNNPAAKPGAYRVIRVTAAGKGKSRLVVRTQAGYIAASEPAPVQEKCAR